MGETSRLWRPQPSSVVLPYAPISMRVAFSVDVLSYFRQDLCVSHVAASAGRTLPAERFVPVP